MPVASEFDLPICAQDFWQDVGPAVQEVLDIAPEYHACNGVAVGPLDAEHPLDTGHTANQTVMMREPVEGFATSLLCDD